MLLFEQLTLENFPKMKMFWEQFKTKEIVAFLGTGIVLQKHHMYILLAAWFKVGNGKGKENNGEREWVFPLHENHSPQFTR